MTLHILSHVPEHAPREGDPHYHLFEQAKARIKKQGLWVCAINDDLCGGPLELHHSHVEFSQAGSVDPNRIAVAFGLHFETDEDFQVWIESPGNLEVLCLPGDESVRMADGSLRAIKDVSIGDRVLGHDAQAHPVASITISTFEGSLIEIDGRCMTGNHPVLTDRGWISAASVRAGDLACFMAPSDAGGMTGEFGVLDADVLAMGGIQAQVLRPIIASDAVDVMDGLGFRERSADHVLHHESVLHDESPAAKRPVDDPNVSAGQPVAQSARALIVPRQFVEADDAASVGAVLAHASVGLPDLDGESGTAGEAVRVGVASTDVAPPQGAALAAARRVPLGEIRGHTVVVATDRAVLDGSGDVAPYERRWRPVLHVEAIPFMGEVYDIEVLGCHSFVATDLVVHNCANHHRTHYGVHVIPSALWETLRWHRAGAKPAAEFIPAKDA
jgi:hypothetical protein